MENKEIDYEIEICEGETFKVFKNKPFNILGWGYCELCDKHYRNVAVIGNLQLCNACIAKLVYKASTTQ